MRIKLFNIYALNLIYNQHLVDITNSRLSIVLTLSKMKLKTRLGGGAEDETNFDYLIVFITHKPRS